MTATPTRNTPKHPTKKTAQKSVPARRPLLRVLWCSAIVGSIVMIVLGVPIIGFGLLPSDAPGFFLLFGLHLLRVVRSADYTDE